MPAGFFELGWRSGYREPPDAPRHWGTLSTKRRGCGERADVGPSGRIFDPQEPSTAKLEPGGLSWRKPASKFRAANVAARKQLC
ncbi:hypothetical protein MPLA_1550034 [Mesorhizobium sp. ORS 3359]|nr:hypothetical protein MPLA_1550034 [Mesorhizobium sp. ORS 3359]